ncbi:MAG: hypothetical protein ACLQJR_03365 [Stellaceae bacterium]
MSLLLIIVVLFLLFGGGGYYGYIREYYGSRGFGGLLGVLIVVCLVIFVFGGFHTHY